MKKNIGLGVILVLIVGSIWYLESMKAQMGGGANAGAPQAINVTATSTPGTSSTPGTPSIPGIPGGEPQMTLAKLSAIDNAAGYPPAVEIADPTGFVNASSSFRLKDLIGKKVILVDFWTYSCINCIRTIPYLTAWYLRYHDAGLEIVGIHTPEFDFEKDITNVQAAVQKFGIHYPVVLDSNYGTWSAYDNHYWPHEFLIDMAGYVVHDQVGEGNYGETEKKIQDLLAERSAILGTQTVPMPTSTVSVPTSVITSGAMSPETYFGSARNDYLGNGTPGVAGVQSFTEPVSVSANTLYLIGTWNVDSQYAETPSSTGNGQTGSDRIDYRYQAKGVYFVAGSANNAPIDVEVLRDGAPIPKNAAGADVFYVGGKSYVRVTGNRLYRVIDDAAAENHLLEFIISSPGLQAYTFTFG